ncbi:MAG: hypothetical protein V1703_02560 [Candidatus Altiarchaeota archaeon]
MKLVSDITLRWYDESSLEEDNPRSLLELLLDSMGITSDVARDLFHVLLVARAEDTALTVKQIRDAIISLRKMRNADKPEKGLTMRNIQVWLQYFREIKLLDKLGDRYHFRGNRRPSKAFAEGTKPMIEESSRYVERVLKRVEDAYGIKQ